MQGWLSLLGPESPISKITFSNNKDLLAAGGNNPSSLFHFNVSNGALLGRYQLPWDKTATLISNGAPYNNLNFLGSSSQNRSDSIGTALLKNHQFTGSYLTHPGIDYQSATFHPYYKIGLTMGRNRMNQTVATFFNPMLPSLGSFTFSTTAFDSFSLIKTSASSPKAFVAGLGAGQHENGHSIALGSLSLIPVPNIEAISLFSPAG
ncbi:MAG: hypothetical protein K2W99_08065, partial [Chthoniobacterales bacterium]|nr:hypothetical protein [Chthoniobacterales bacterium]